MLRHSCGFYLANRGCDLRLIQDYLGHRNPKHTAHYTPVAGSRFEGLWRWRASGPPVNLAAGDTTGGSEPTKDGFHATIVQEPLTGLAEDVDATKRVIDLQTGPVMLVGHSYGSPVIAEPRSSQKPADETSLTLQVCHFPPGTSKWNKIEHRLFCHITQTWRGKPLTSRLVVVELIAATTTKTGLQVHRELDLRAHPKGIKVSDAEMHTLNITANAFHPEWNYATAPRAPPRSSHCWASPWGARSFTVCRYRIVANLHRRLMGRFARADGI